MRLMMVLNLVGLIYDLGLELHTSMLFSLERNTHAMINEIR